MALPTPLDSSTTANVNKKIIPLYFICCTKCICFVSYKKTAFITPKMQKESYKSFRFDPDYFMCLEKRVG